MFGKVTPEKVIRFTTICAQLVACLPPPASAKKSEIMRYQIYWWFNFCISLLTILPIMYDTYLNIEDVNGLLLDMAELCPLCTGSLKMWLCKTNGKKLWACISEMENFLKTATLRERESLQGYVDRCIKFHYFMLFCIVTTTLGFSSSPVFLPQPYPAHTSYPFEVNTELLKNFLRATQIVALFQTGILVAMDFEFSTLVWFTAARFELLSEELRRVSDRKQCCICIQKHQELLRELEILAQFWLPAPARSNLSDYLPILIRYWDEQLRQDHDRRQRYWSDTAEPLVKLYLARAFFVMGFNRMKLDFGNYSCVIYERFIFAEDVNLVTRFIAYGLGCSTTIGIVCGGLQLLRDVPAQVKGRFVSFVMAGGLQLFVYSWPAENLIENSGAIGFSMYSSNWIGQSPEMTNLIFIVMLRAKKPAIISIGDFLPMLSLSLYGSFLSTCFSYFTTLRATVTTSAS